MPMQRQHFVSLQTMQRTGSTGAGLQLVDRRHLMVSLSTFVVSLRFILWIIYAEICREIYNISGSHALEVVCLFDLKVFLCIFRNLFSFQVLGLRV